MVTGALAPYTQVLYRALAAALDAPLTVLACAAREPARQWQLAAADGYGFSVLPACAGTGTRCATSTSIRASCSASRPCGRRR